MDYSYSFTATFADPAVLDANGFLVSTGSPQSIEGSFTGTFVSTYDLAKNPIDDGDKYGFDIRFSKSWFTSDGGSYEPITPHSEFGAIVPLPAATWTGLVGLGALAFGHWIRSRRNSK